MEFLHYLWAINLCEKETTVIFSYENSLCISSELPASWTTLETGVSDVGSPYSANQRDVLN